LLTLPTCRLGDGGSSSARSFFSEGLFTQKNPRTLPQKIRKIRKNPKKFKISIKIPKNPKIIKINPKNPKIFFEDLKSVHPIWD
jgi:hypothetical protein